MVRSIMEHWVVNREWWREPGPVPDQLELQFWQVEAAPGHGASSGAYELCRDLAAVTWTLRRVAD